MKHQQMQKATYWEMQASIFGACFIAFGLGVYLSNYLQIFTPFIILLGIVLHGWGMYKIHHRNN